MLKRLISTSVLVVLVGAASGASAFTNTSDKRTFFTFSQPVALPGVTLPAGTYMFRLADDTTTRKVIQVTNRQGTESFAMLHTMPVYRPDAPRDPEVRFMETASGAPIAVRAWWQEGERTGYGFIYSKEELAALNRGTAAADSRASAGIEERAVPSADAELEADASAGEPVAAAEGPLSGPDVIDGAGAPPEEPEQQVAQLPASEQAPPAQSQQAAPAQSVRQDTARDQLPQTASPLALLLLGGLASASVGLKMLRKS
jgi:hypothetical protein